MKAVRNIYDKTLSHDLTLEEAKQFDCCKGLTEEEIKELLEELKIFTEIAYAIFAKQKEEEKKQQEENEDYKLAA